jgi:hypothetical protein
MVGIDKIIQQLLGWVKSDIISSEQMDLLLND